MAAHPAVQHALQVREAVAGGDFAAFFKLYAAAPNLGRALMDMALPRVRYSALHVLTRAYQPSVPVALVARLLGFVARSRAASCPSEEMLPGCSRPVFAGAAAPQVTAIPCGRDSGCRPLLAAPCAASYQKPPLASAGKRRGRHP